MKFAKNRWPRHPVPAHPTPRPREVRLTTREERLIHRIARNSPSANRRLARLLSRQRRAVRGHLSAARRFARRLAGEPKDIQRAIRQLMDSPFFIGLGSLQGMLPTPGSIRARDAVPEALQAAAPW